MLGQHLFIRARLRCQHPPQRRAQLWVGQHRPGLRCLISVIVPYRHCSARPGAGATGRMGEGKEWKEVIEAYLRNMTLYRHAGTNTGESNVSQSRA